jgi:competence ComEA-like helix-hairpin-helix protein
VNRIVTVILTVLFLTPGIVMADEPKAVKDSPVSAAKTLPQKLDLNRASQSELVGVPGIGPKLAQAIVELRLQKGSFARVEDLLEVTGIKEKKFATIVGYLEVIPLQPSAKTAPAVQSR